MSFDRRDPRIGQPWTQTFSANPFWAHDPKPQDIEIVDVAHALALVNRYNGHTRTPYSVAQHSVLVSYACDPKDALWGLLHDASEAYIGDLVSPVKRRVPQYNEIESRLMAAVCTRFGLQMEMPESVKVADLTVLAAERRDLFPVVPLDWKLPYKPAAYLGPHPYIPFVDLRVIRPLPWRKAERLFLERYMELTSR